MRVNPINNTNFKGLWFREKIVDLERKNFMGSEMLDEYYVYRPWSDEDPEEAKEEVEKYDKRPINIYYTPKRIPDAIIDVTARLGEPLNISSEEYKKIKSPLEPNKEKREQWQ